MITDENVQMISAEDVIIFAKAWELTPAIIGSSLKTSIPTFGSTKAFEHSNI